MNRCVIICASPYYQQNFIKSQITSNDYIICADGGYDIAQSVNIMPDYIIGDFDSSELKTNNKLHVVKLPVEKDDTDSIYCAKYAVSNGFNNFLILAATGGRLDHMYANFALLQYLYRKNCKAVIKDAFTSVYYTEKELTLHCKNKTVSVLPYGCTFADVTLKGFKYKADKLKMTSDFPIGISNIATDETSIVTVYNGGVLIMVNSLQN